ncbi:MULTISPECIES: DUF6612 family protein [Shouchella]|uniref:Lipoprotein n=2 Tax=Shouchella TaxID=2893057 RepID=A0ABY7WA75_9BACI|nr:MULTISPECIES: DUF6612 family protein [Shouchella]MED4126783.1 hypothetical protein [Shouchella miscanthi]WDF04514.1 hypothetical protein PQ477_03290 [Shouchella hunanensis]
MKKTPFILIAAIALAGCQDDQADQGEIDTILENAQEQMAEKTSYQMDTTASGQEGQGSVTTTKIIREPFAFSISEQQAENEEEGQPAMTFMHDGAFYTEEPMLEEWIQLSAEESGISGSESFQPAEDQLTTLANHTDALSLEETEDHYHLSASGTDDEVKNLALAFMGESPEELEVDLQDFNFELLIQKDNFTQERSELSMEGEIAEVGQLFSEEVVYEFSQFDQLEEVDYDEDAIEQAITLEEAQEKMAEMQADLEQEMEEQEE